MKTLKDLQADAAWGSQTYSEAFNADRRPHRDMAHAVQHIHKAGGKLAAALDDLDHGESTDRSAVERALADTVICALRAANQWPGGAIDLQAAVEARMESKGMGAEVCPACHGAGEVTAWNAGTITRGLCSTCGGRGRRSPAGAAAAQRSEPPRRALVDAIEVEGSNPPGWLVTLSCGHKRAVREKLVEYQCRECARGEASRG